MEEQSFLAKIRNWPKPVKIILFFAINLLAMYILKYLFESDASIENNSRLPKAVWIVSALIITFTYYLFFPRNKKHRSN